jgi:peptidoglycan hydrolase-like protein with peptidoglycan-binding domain
MPRVSQFNQVAGNPHGTNDSVMAGVLHRTYSPSIGSAFNAILNNGTAHTLHGDGHSDEFMDMLERAYHANGANWKAIGAEFHGTNEDPLTDDQVRDLAILIVFGRDVLGIPVTYLNPFDQAPASVHVNAGVYSGWLSHYSVQTDDGSAQHTDLVTVEDWNRAMAVVNGGAIPPPTPGVGPVAPPPDDGTLHVGSSGPAVALWQAQLNQYGNAGLAVDGDFGPATDQATRNFQTFFGLTVDGIVGPQTQGVMNAIVAGQHGTPSANPNVPPFPGRNLSIGDSGDDVRQWQAQMAARGWTIGVDGDFGPQTDSVCRQFQAEKGLQVDGVVGPNTWSAAWAAPIT